MSDLVRIHKTIHSWESTLFRIDVERWRGIVGFDFEEKRERKVVYGARRDGKPMGKTAGKYSVPSCSLKMLKASWGDPVLGLMTYLTAKGLLSYGDADFILSCQYIELGSVMTEILDGCTIDGVKDSAEEGIDELVTELEIGALTATRNGMRLWSATRELGL